METDRNDSAPASSPRTLELPQGTIHYRDIGQGAPLLFMHGLLVNGTLWRKVTPQLEGEFRCLAPDLPLGSHRVPLADGADRSPRGVAHLVADMLDALALEDVTVVANDTGGAIAQLLVTERPQRIGRLVLTPCDLYENFLPPAFRPLQWAARAGLLPALLGTMRVRRLRRSPLAYGMLTHRPVPDDVLEGWVRPFLDDRRVRADVTATVRAIDSRDTVAAAARLREQALPVLVAWAPEDRFFKLRFAQRLVGELPDARLELVEDSLTFMPEDQPERLAELIAEFARQPRAVRDGAGAAT
jgi:pimeloyl-ACP methyl ester carboxylesterase